ncbi:MAG: hypothetical protein V4732_04075 [Pseudomonadota bacterium]
MLNYKLVLPDDFDDYEWEVKSKGWFNGVAVIFQNKKYILNFYDPIRLSQEIGDELSDSDVFFEDNLIVVHSVDRSQIEKAVDFLAKAERLTRLKPEQ